MAHDDVIDLRRSRIGTTFYPPRELTLPGKPGTFRVFGTRYWRSPDTGRVLHVADAQQIVPGIRQPLRVTDTLTMMRLADEVTAPSLPAEKTAA